MKSNTWTIIRKEFARFFGDRSLIFTSVIMPGLLIYIIYSMIGSGIERIVSDGANEVVTLRVENMPESLAGIIGQADSSLVICDSIPIADEEIALLEDKDLNVVLMRFTAGFDSLVATYDPSSGLPAPNVEIYYNSTNNASTRVYNIVDATLKTYEDQMSNRFDVNRADSEEQKFDVASDDSKGAMVWSKILPMLIVMMLFSGTMAIAPSAIAGEKERGTIATLLVTPMRRNELALGKIVSLSAMALLSGISSFIGIALSLPKMIPSGEDVDISFHYAFGDYAVLMLVIFATVLIMASVVSLLSALAKDVKSAGTMITPFMLIIMVAGLLPMFQNGVAESLTVYLIPFYNSIEVMASVLSHEVNWNTVIVTLCANLCYTGIAVWLLTRMFNSERIMFKR